MKTVTVSFLDPSFRRVLGEASTVQVNDDGDFLDVMAAMDAIYMKSPVRVKRGNVEVSSILKLVWNAGEGRVYQDIGIEARDAARRWVPVMADPLAPLPGGSTILVSPDPGC